MDVLKVSSKSKPNSVAGALANALSHHRLWKSKQSALEH